MRKSILGAMVCLMVTVGLIACGGSDPTPSNNASGDSISITSISPASAVQGANTSFAVAVSYSLASKDSGLLMVGFNTSEVNSYSMISSATYTVAKGSGTHTFNVTTTPVNWGSNGSFQAYVNLAENPHPSPWTPLANDTKSISTTSSAPGLDLSSKDFMSVSTSIQCNSDVCL